HLHQMRARDAIDPRRLLDGDEPVTGRRGIHQDSQRIIGEGGQSHGTSQGSVGCVKFQSLACQLMSSPARGKAASGQSVAITKDIFTIHLNVGIVHPCFPNLVSRVMRSTCPTPTAPAIAPRSSTR